MFKGKLSISGGLRIRFWRIAATNSATKLMDLIRIIRSIQRKDKRRRFKVVDQF